MSISIIQSSTSSLTSSSDVQRMKQSISEYSDIIVNSAIFNSNNNQQELKELFTKVLEDLYINVPQEAIDFLNQKPSKNLVNSIFISHGIDTSYVNNYPEILKTKTMYMLSQLFEWKGSNVVFELFNEIVQEFYQNLNFYNVVVEQRHYTSKYETPVILSKYFVNQDGTIDNSYLVSDASADTVIDASINLSVYSTLDITNKFVKYHLKFDSVLKQDVLVHLLYNEPIIVPAGVDEFYYNRKTFDIYPKNRLSKNDLVYKLEPVLINDANSIMTEITQSDLDTNKYLMRLEDYYNGDFTNSSMTNVFPIRTNIVFIQFNTSNSIDPMVFYPDLIRMFAMTTLQNSVFTFSVNGTIAKMTIQEYMNMLMYLKLSELKLKNDYTWSTTDTNLYTNFIYPIEYKQYLYDLIVEYKDMKHDYNQFHSFKKKFQELLGLKNQLNTTKIHTFQELRESLAGLEVNSIEQFFEILEARFPDGVYYVTNVDQNKIIRKLIYDLYDLYKPSTYEELKTIIQNYDTSYVGLNSTVYDTIKQVFTEKYPRLVQKIDAITDPAEFINIYLDNYKRMTVQVSKEDNFCLYFVNDTFQRFMLAGTFKQYFFTPIFDLFAQYFFRAEQSYQNTGGEVYQTKDKMQMVVVGADIYNTIDLEGYFSEISPLDDIRLLTDIKNSEEQINIKDYFSIEISDGSNTTHYTD